MLWDEERARAGGDETVLRTSSPRSGSHSHIRTRRRGARALSRGGAGASRPCEGARPAEEQCEQGVGVPGCRLQCPYAAVTPEQRRGQGTGIRVSVRGRSKRPLGGEAGGDVGVENA